MRLEQEEGQAVVLLALAMGIFLLGAVGLAIDGSQLYAQFQMAQAAADSAAIAGIMDVFDGTSGGFTVGTNYTCTTTDTSTPCVYARKNLFGGTSADSVLVEFPASQSGVMLSNAYPHALMRVTVSRNVPTTLMRLLGPTSTTIRATATAGIVAVTSPVPILVAHPTLTQSFDLQGTPTVQICGGPSRSIQVNSSDGTAAATGGNATVDLSHAGPLDPGTCTTGTGADFGVWGGPSSTTAVSVNYGTLPGKYVQPASILQDPLRNVSAPSIPTIGGVTGAGQLNGTQTALGWGATGTAGTPTAGVTCPASTKPQGCTVLTPGLFPTGIALSGTTALFKPGIYYLQGSNGFTCGANCNMQMVSGTADGTCTYCSGTGWDGTVANGGMLVYNTGTGQFTLGANGTISLIGAPATCTSPCTDYKGILFFEDHTAAANNSTVKHSTPHTLGGGGAMTLIGTIYLTNTRATMLATPTQYQELDLQGGSGSGTVLEGEIIVDSLQLGGNGSILMNLNSNASYVVSQVALVN